VQILLGKDRGKSGKVERILNKHKKLLVAGVNIYKRHVGKRVTGVEGQTIDIIKPVDLSNVALICPNCNKPTRVGFKIEGQTKFRICKKCGKEIG